jgi:hypothetical protein
MDSSREVDYELMGSGSSTGEISKDLQRADYA